MKPNVPLERAGAIIQGWYLLKWACKEKGVCLE